MSSDLLEQFGCFNAHQLALAMNKGDEDKAHQLLRDGKALAKQLERELEAEPENDSVRMNNRTKAARENYLP